MVLAASSLLSAVAIAAPVEPNSVDLSFDAAALPEFNFGMLQDDETPAEVPEASADGAAEMARKLQDPLANISAIMTDNAILFKTGNDDVSYNFQIQPVHAFDFPDQGFTLIARGVIPILGLAPEAQRPIVGPPLPAGGSRTWGIGDTVAQFFIAPKSDAAWKWGVGPQFSLRTRTDSKLGGPGWGAGPVGVLAGSLSDDVSLALIGGHLWSYDGDFSTTLIQPMMFYNFPDLPGVSIGYNGAITYDWKADSGDAWTVPVGASLGKAFNIGDGYGLDLNGGAYWNAVKPDGAAEWQLKFGISLIFP